MHGMHTPSATHASLQQRPKLHIGFDVVPAHAMSMHMTFTQLAFATITHLQQLSQLPMHLFGAVLCQQAGAEGGILAVARFRVPQLPHNDGHHLPAQGLQAALQVLCSLCQVPCSQYLGCSGSRGHIWPGPQKIKSCAPLAPSHMSGCTQWQAPVSDQRS